MVFWDTDTLLEPTWSSFAPLLGGKTTTNSGIGACFVVGETEKMAGCGFVRRHDESKFVTKVLGGERKEKVGHGAWAVESGHGQMPFRSGRYGCSAGS
jgi:hypothetical protein